MKIGDKVVCVDDSKHGPLPWGDGDIPVKGRVYVIRDFEIADNPAHLGQLCVFLLGMKIISWSGFEYGYLASRFRLLDEMKEESRNKHIEAQGSGISMESLSVDTLHPPKNW